KLEDGLPPELYASRQRSFLFYECFLLNFATHPNEPHPELGLVHALGSHGSYVFISDTESTSLFLLRQAFIIAASLFLLVVPKEFKLQPPSESQSGWH